MFKNQASPISPNIEQARWLRVQFETGAIPRDPELIAALVEQVCDEPVVGSNVCLRLRTLWGGSWEMGVGMLDLGLV